MFGLWYFFEENNDDVDDDNNEYDDDEDEHLHVCAVRIIIQLNVGFPDLRLAKVDLFQPCREQIIQSKNGENPKEKKSKIDLRWRGLNTSELSWIPGQILICPVQSHPAVHLVQVAWVIIQAWTVVYLRVSGRVFCNFEPDCVSVEIDLKNGNFLIEVEMYKRHSQVNPHWLRMVVHLSRK